MVAVDKDRLERLYFDWLIDLIGGKYGNYSKLINHLYEVPFRYFYPHDENWAGHGKYLQYEFSYEKGIDPKFDNGKICSLLEMFTALAKQIGFIIIGDDDTARWFWFFMHNLDLEWCTDEHFDELYVHYILQKFMNRDYDSDGFGSCFRDEKQDEKQDLELKSRDLWYQMCWYFDRNPGLIE